MTIGSDLADKVSNEHHRSKDIRVALARLISDAISDMLNDLVYLSKPSEGVETAAQKTFDNQFAGFIHNNIFVRRRLGDTVDQLLGRWSASAHCSTSAEEK